MEEILVNLIQAHGALTVCDEYINQIQDPADEFDPEMVQRYGSIISLVNNVLNDTINKIEAMD